MADRRTLGWAGCVLCGLVVVAALLAVVYYSVQSANRHAGYGAEPTVRTAEALSILGARSFPAGYYAASVMTLPGLVEAVVLTGVPPDQDAAIEPFRRRLFIYLKTRTSSPADVPEDFQIKPLLDVWPGRLKLELEETPAGEWERARGSVQFPTYQAVWRMGRGSASLGPGELDGAFMLLSLECLDDDRQRTALWFANESGDPERLRSFLSSLQPCGL